MRVGGGKKSYIFDDFFKTALREVSGTTFLPTFVILGSILGGNWGHFWSHFGDFFSSAIFDAIFSLIGSPGGRGGNLRRILSGPVLEEFWDDLIRPALWHSAADLKASPLPPAP